MPSPRKAEPDLSRRAGKRGRIITSPATEAQPARALAAADKEDQPTEANPQLLRSLGYVGGAAQENVAELAVSPVQVGAPAVTTESQVGQQITLSYTTEPTVDIRITPQSVEEYTAIYAALTSGTIAAPV